VIATNVEKARDHNPALHHAQACADRFEHSADHVAASNGRKANANDPQL
jgi:hypothetical protein